MPDDAVTRLIVEGGALFVKTLSDAAIAQDRLTDSIRNASTRPATALAENIEKVGATSAQVDKVRTAFQELLKAQGQSAEVVEKTTQAIEKQNKALLQNAQATQQAAKPSQISQGFETEAAAKFRLTAPAAITQGPSKVDLSGTTAAIGQQGNAFQRSGAQGISYLTTLSAIHAASFLLTGSTFSTLQSVTTLGVAFGNAFRGAQSFNQAAGFLGASIGVASVAVHFLVDSMTRVIEIVEAAGQKLLQFGAIGAVAFAGAVAGSVKLASGFEDVAAEIAAFGEPSREQLSTLEEKISSLARKFGESASAIGEGASLFIRAGGDIATAIDGGVAAVTRLTIASRGELIPATAARAVVTVTNAFKEFGTTADEAVNIVVGTAQKTALSFSEVTQAFQQAAPTAALLKIPLLDLAATIGVLSNEGLRGTVAGTGFKQFLLDLLNPSERAKSKLEELGVSIQDSSGKIRPLRDIFIDLQRALGDEANALDKSGDASKAQALALIFGSRANLAAAIIARTGAEAFDQLKESIAAVSAEDVVNILLSTTAAQAAIAKTNIEELARAFGGPLNVAVGTALKSVNSFLQGIDRNAFAQAGEAILAVVSGQGFGAIKTALDSIPDTRIGTFLEGLLNDLLTVRNAVVSQLIPALEQAGSNIAEAFLGSQATQGLNNITGAIVTLIAAGSRLIIFLSEVVASFISGDERGQAIRDTISKIATTIGSALTTAFAAAAAQILIGIAALQAFNALVLKTLELVANVSIIPNVGAINQLKKDLSDTSTAAQATRDNIANLDTGLAELKDTRDKLVTQVQAVGVANAPELMPGALAELSNIQANIDLMEERRNRLINQEGSLRQQVDQTTASLEEQQGTIFGTINELKERFSGGFNVDKIIDSLKGDIPGAMAAIAAQITDLQNNIARGGPEAPESTASAFFPDPTKMENAARQATDIIRRAQQETADVIADAGVKEQELTQSTLDRLITLHTNYNRAIEKLDSDTAKRIARSDEDFAQHRKDRDDLQVISRGLERESFLRDQAHSRRDLQIRQEDAAEDRSNQRRIQDQDSTLSKLESREQRSEDIKQSIRDRAFQRQQQDDERSFSRRQAIESTGFERNLQDQATARENARRLAEAKTPQERSDVQKQIQQSRSDTVFARSQEDQLTKFRIQQDEARTKFQRQQEDTAFQRSVQNEQDLFDFRVRLELKYLQRRRDLEDIEIGRQAGVERDRLERSLGFSQDDTNFRLGQADKLQAAQDTQADEQHNRERQRIQDDAAEQRKELGTRLQEDIFNLFDDADRRRAGNLDSQLKTLRNIAQRSTLELQQLGEREPLALPAAQAGILALNLDLVQTDLLLTASRIDAEKLSNTLRNQSLTGFNLPLEAPRRSVTLGIPSFPPEITNQFAQAQRQLDLSPLLQVLPQAVVAGIREAQLSGIGNKSVTIQGNSFNNDQMWQLIQQYLYNSR